MQVFLCSEMHSAVSERERPQIASNTLQRVLKKTQSYPKAS